MARVGRSGPPLALMALIWFLSAQPDLDSGLEQDFVLRKIGHAVVFGTLYLLWRRATTAGWALSIALGWAALDEHHQSWVPGRHGTVRDVLIDAAGVAAAHVLLRRRLRRPSGS